MYYNGKELSLREYVAAREKDCPSKPGYEDEGLIFAIQEYQSAVGEFSEDDKKFLEENGLCEEDFQEEEL